MGAKCKNRERLEGFNFDELIKEYSYSDLCIKFAVSYRIIKEVARNHFYKKDISDFEKNPDPIEFIGTQGAWKELKRTQMYKNLMYGR